MKNDEGFTLIGILIALCIFSFLILVVGQEINFIGKTQKSSTTKIKALIDAVNTMEELKNDEVPASGKEEKEEFVIESQVGEFSPEIYELKVMVEDKNGEEILSLQTLREK